MTLRTLTSTCVALAMASFASASDLLAIKVGHAETISHGRIDHAVILIEDGKIVTIGQDLPIERGIPVIDVPNLWVMPGLVDAYSRIGLEGRAGSEFTPENKAENELFPRNDDYQEVLNAGVTTLGQYPAGTGGVPGQACVVRPKGATKQEMLIKSGAYLMIVFRADARSKKMVRDAFEKATEYADKEKKAREKFDKDQASKKKSDEKKPEDKKDEKKEGSSASAQDGAAADDKQSDKKDESGGTKYTPPEPDEKTKPILDLRAGKLRALVTLFQAADWLHFKDAIKEEKFGYDLRIPMTRETDIFEIMKEVGEKKLRIVCEPEITLTPSTMRQRNLPSEFVKAGAKLVFLPRQDTIAIGANPFSGSAPMTPFKSWLRSVGEIVAAGLDRDVALRAVTLEPAEMLGLADRVGSLDKGKDANLVFYTDDPIEPMTRLKAVMLEGRVVHGEVKQ